MIGLEKTTSALKHLKQNGFVVIDGAPCKVDKIQASSTGKHGHAKIRLEGVDLFNGIRRTIVGPAHENVDVPILSRYKGQVVSIMGTKAQIMDLSNYSVFELDIPEERKSEIKAGEEIEYFEICDIKTLKKLK